MATVFWDAKGVILLDNLPQGWEILPHPAHSPDLAPSDFHLFGPLKRHLGGMAFETEDDLISELRNWFDNLDVDFFRSSKWIENTSPQQGNLRLSGPPSGQDAGGGARTCDRRVPADLRADSLATVPSTPRAVYTI
ncbi:histone-lysine N-methyltransferase SETMAR [Plakobranchus ocellatus]|uniref:Histone-lysine N-methyltransferase SETMAR n=1 Tax=Plakobranchus ocellatus TaxID=259542 RepID=A0AAV4BZG6_9GAST|nr:histone-lysine N-methyltransferase SETMAR [Plakobranchus ocellatus]